MDTITPCTKCGGFPTNSTMTDRVNAALRDGPFEVETIAPSARVGGPIQDRPRDIVAALKAEGWTSAKSGYERWDLHSPDGGVTARYWRGAADFPAAIRFRKTA